MKSINKNDIDKLDFWLLDKDTEQFVHICEGTGDNLLPEDIEEGYVDYIYYSIYDTLEDVQNDMESDGGMVLLEKYYAELSLEEIVAKVCDMETIVNYELFK